MANPEADPTTDAPSTAPAEPDGRGWRPYRLSVRQYLRMIRAGIFPHDARVELIGGILVEQMTKGTPHDYTLDALCDELRQRLPAGQILREDKSLHLGRGSRPEPDVAVVAGPRSRYKDRDPVAADVTLVVEVAGSTYGQDRGMKWRLYARARIPTYWIINLRKRQIEVFRNPVGRGPKAEYQAVEVYDESNIVPVVLAGVEVGRVAVADILP